MRFVVDYLRTQMVNGLTMIRKLSIRYVQKCLSYDLTRRVLIVDRRCLGVQTEAVVDKYMNARIVGNPLGKKACLKFQKKHKEYVLFFSHFIRRVSLVG